MAIPVRADGRGGPRPLPPDRRETATCQPLARRLDTVTEYRRGTNPRITSAAAMVKTTSLGGGSRLLRLRSVLAAHATNSQQRHGDQQLASLLHTAEHVRLAQTHLLDWSPA